MHTNQKTNFTYRKKEGIGNTFFVGF